MHMTAEVYFHHHFLDDPDKIYTDHSYLVCNLHNPSNAHVELRAFDTSFFFSCFSLLVSCV